MAWAAASAPRSAPCPAHMRCHPHRWDIQDLRRFIRDKDSAAQASLRVTSPGTVIRRQRLLGRRSYKFSGPRRPSPVALFCHMRAPAHLLRRRFLLLGVGGGRAARRRRVRRRGSAAFARFRAGLGALGPAYVQLPSDAETSVQASWAPLRLGSGRGCHGSLCCMLNLAT